MSEIPLEEIAVLDDPLFADADPPLDPEKNDGTFYTKKQIESLNEIDVDEESEEKAKKIAAVSKAFSELAQSNNRTLQNQMNAGRFVDISEAEVYLRGIVTAWVDSLRTIGDDYATIAQRYDVSTETASRIAKDIANRSIKAGEEILADLEEYTEKFIITQAAKRLTKGSGSNMRRGRAGSERVK